MLKGLIKKYENMNAPVKMAFWFLICSFLQKGIGLITTPIFTRIMTDGEFGRYSVYNSWYSIISIFATLSISGNCFTRGLVINSEEKKRNELASSFYGLIVLLVAGFGMIYLVFQNWFNHTTQLTSYQFLMMGIDFLTIPASSLWINAKRVKYEYKGIVILTVSTVLLRPVIAILFVINAPESQQVEARLTGVAIANVTLFSWIIIYILNKGKRFYSRKNWKYAVTFCIPLIPHYLSQTILNQSDRIMISRIIGDSEAGYYSIAYTLAAIMGMVNSSVAQSLDPWIYRSIHNKDLDRIAPVSYSLTVIIALLNFIIMALAPEALALIAPSSYQGALWVIPPVTASVFFQFMYDLFASFQFYFEKTKWIAVGSCGGAILNVVLNAIFIPAYGYVAAGYTTLVCYIMFGVLHYLFMRKVCKEKLENIIVYDWRIVFGIGFLLVVSSFVMVLLYQYSIIRYCLLILLLLLLIINRNKVIKVYREIKKRGE